MKRSDFEYLLTVLTKNAGWHFDEDNYFVIDKKVSNFVREKGYNSVEELINEVRLGHKATISQLIESIALSDTYFYRDYDVFARFENIVLPHMREVNRSAKKLRVWSIGCASGQEVYSIAIAIKNKLIGINDWNVEILGTDLSTPSINKAQKGSYSNLEIQMGLNIETIVDNFSYDKGEWKASDDLMKMVKFMRYNLLDDMIINDKYEIIFCRNVLRFFTKEMQKKIIDKIYRAQTDGGFLYLGKGEYVEGLDNLYGKVPGFTCLYQAKNINDEERRLYNEEKEAEKEDEMPSFHRDMSFRPSLKK